MLMTEYETTLIFRPDLSSQNIDDTLGHLRNVVGQKGGKFLEINHWGKKKLAYDIQKFSRGIYVHTMFLGKNDLVAELERNLRISDKVLRFLTVKTAVDVDPASRQEKAYEGLKDEHLEERVEEAPAPKRGFEAAPAEEVAAEASAEPEAAAEPVAAEPEAAEPEAAEAEAEEAEASESAEETEEPAN